MRPFARGLFAAIMVVAAALGGVACGPGHHAPHHKAKCCVSY